MSSALRRGALSALQAAARLRGASASRRQLGRCLPCWSPPPPPCAAAAAFSTLPTADSSNAKGDLRGTSGVGLGDGLDSHTDKWMTPEPGKKSPMQLIAEVEPIGVEGDVAVCYGHEDPVLGHPVEFIKVAGVTKDNPAVCKYCGLRYYQKCV